MEVIVTELLQDPKATDEDLLQTIKKIVVRLELCLKRIEESEKKNEDIESLRKVFSMYERCLNKLRLRLYCDDEDDD